MIEDQGQDDESAVGLKKREPFWEVLCSRRLILGLALEDIRGLRISGTWEDMDKVFREPNFLVPNSARRVRVHP